MKKIINLALLFLFLMTLASNILAEVNYGELMEDISVMARIIDKTLVGKFPGEYGSEKIGFFGGSSGCDGIYLKDYGVVFITDISFPVSAQKVEEKKEVKPDDLWQQTKEEIEKGASAPTAGTKVVYGNQMLPQQTYDPVKVETLKQELVSLILTYGQNIRNLSPQDSIVIVIKGSTKGSDIFTYQIFDKLGSSGVNTSKATIENWYGEPHDSLVVSEPYDPPALPESNDSGSISVGGSIPEIVPAPNMPIGTDVAMSGVPIGEPKKQMEAARVGAEVASNVAKQLADQKKEIDKSISIIASSKRDTKTSMLTIKIKKSDIARFASKELDSKDIDEIMKNVADITQF